MKIDLDLMTKVLRRHKRTKAAWYRLAEGFLKPRPKSIRVTIDLEPLPLMRKLEANWGKLQANQRWVIGADANGNPVLLGIE